MYSAAVAVVRTLGLQTYPQGDSEDRPCSKAEKSAWMRRVENWINATRTKISRLKEYQRGNSSMKVVRQIAEMVKPKELRDLTDANITEVLDIHLQRLSALANDYDVMLNARSGKNKIECSTLTRENFTTGSEMISPILEKGSRILATLHSFGLGDMAVLVVTAQDIRRQRSMLASKWLQTNRI